VTFSPNPINDAREINIVVSDPSSLNGQEEIELSISDQGNVFAQPISILRTVDGVAPELLDPADNITDEGLSPTLSWASGDNETTDFLVEVSLDEQFLQVVVSDTVTSSDYVIQSSLETLTTYFWRITTIGECQDYPSQAFSFETGLGTATIDETLFNINVYPSPADNFVILDISDAISANSFEVFDMMGRLILPRTDLNTSINRLDASYFAEGIYLMRINSDKGIYTTRFVIAR